MTVDVNKVLTHHSIVMAQLHALCEQLLPTLQVPMRLTHHAPRCSPASALSDAPRTPVTAPAVLIRSLLACLRSFDTMWQGVCKCAGKGVQSLHC